MGETMLMSLSSSSTTLVLSPEVRTVASATSSAASSSSSSSYSSCDTSPANSDSESERAVFDPLVWNCEQNMWLPHSEHLAWLDQKKLRNESDSDSDCAASKRRKKKKTRSEKKSIVIQDFSDDSFDDSDSSLLNELQLSQLTPFERRLFLVLEECAMGYLSGRHLSEAVSSTILLLGLLDLKYERDHLLLFAQGCQFETGDYCLAFKQKVLKDKSRGSFGWIRDIVPWPHRYREQLFTVKQSELNCRSPLFGCLVQFKGDQKLVPIHHVFPTHIINEEGYMVRLTGLWTEIRKEQIRYTSMSTGYAGRRNATVRVLKLAYRKPHSDKMEVCEYDPTQYFFVENWKYEAGMKLGLSELYVGYPISGGGYRYFDSSFKRVSKK